MEQKTFNKLSRTWEYSSADEEIAFKIWYEEGRCSNAVLRGRLPDGVEPSAATIKKWKNKGKWAERADALNDLVSKQTDKDLVKEKIEMINRHREVGKEMIVLGLEYFKVNGVNSDHVAAKLIVDGAKIEHQNAGLSALVETARDMSDEKIMEQILAMTEEGALYIPDDVS